VRTTTSCEMSSKRPLRLVPFFLIVSAIFSSPSSGPADLRTTKRIDAEIDRIGDEIIKIRRFLHMNPELSNREFETSRLVASKLESLGLEVKTGIAKTGVKAVLRGVRTGASVAVRADMDALPIQEMTSLPYASLNPGVMHACGHDIHTSVILGTAMVLSALRDMIGGTVTFIFQPAEEGPPPGEEGGADLMVREGVLDNPPVAAVFGFHVMPEDLGQVFIAPGNVTASSARFRIAVKGRSAHGAKPHEGVDAVLVASEVVSAFQTIVSRSTDPTDPAVLSVGTIRGGSRFNIIADEVVLEGTVRALSDANREKIPERMETVLKNITEAHGAAYEFEYKSLTPSVYNNPELTAAMTPTLVKLLGKDSVREWKPQMIAEDFSAFAAKVPGLYLFLGVKDPAQARMAPLHSPTFNPDERCIPLGIRVISHLVLDALEKQASPARNQTDR
jgi:amidohydrolase